MLPDFEAFLRKARLHWTAWMIAEFAAMGLLSGCGAVVILLPILIWRGEPGQTVALLLPSLGALVGALVGFRARPKIRDVAILADARFQTADLLATALALRDSSDGAGSVWNAGILRMANVCASQLLPSRLTPHKLGPRAWSGILIAMLAAMTLGALSITTPNNQTQAANPQSSADAWGGGQPVKPQGADPVQLAASPAIEARAENTPDSHPMASTDQPAEANRSVAPSPHTARDVQADSGAGAGSARTGTSQIGIPADHAASASPSNEGAVASGGGGGEARPTINGAASGGLVSADRQTVIAPWSAAGWPAAEAAAMNAMQQGRIPDAYRSIVSDYFDRSNREDGPPHQ